MHRRNNKILAIDPGTRKMGFALLDGERLVYHGVKDFRWQDSPHAKLGQARRFVLRLIEDFDPGTLAMEKAFFANNRTAATLNALADEIRCLAKKRKLQIVALHPSTVKKAICGNGHASKRQVANAVVAEYPELKVFLTQDREWKERFHQNMFDAVALGIVARKRLARLSPVN